MLDAGNTVPFIARYRKERTGGMSDEVLRDFYERLQYLKNLEERKEACKLFNGSNRDNNSEKVAKFIIHLLEKS